MKGQGGARHLRPRQNGQMTPESATRKAVTLASRIRSMSVSRPGDEHQHDSADLREEQKCIGCRSAAEESHVKEVEAAGPGNNSYQQFPQDGRDAKAGTERGHDLPGRQQNGDQQRKLQAGRHPCLLGSHQCRRSLLLPGAAAETEYARQQAGVASALDAFAQHGADGRGLAASQL